MLSRKSIDRCIKKNNNAPAEEGSEFIEGMPLKAGSCIRMVRTKNQGTTMAVAI
jgi:hypothetical protein